MSEPLEPYRPEPTSSWDYTEEPEEGPRVLWGRVVALGAAVLIAFLVGRATAPDGGSLQEVEELKAQVDSLSDENADLRARLEAKPSPTPTASPRPTRSPRAEGEIYVVERGDTLRGIALRFYGDATLDDCIMEANGISDATQLSVGAELVIPAEEDC